jgi:hypothetical protein
VALEPIWVGHVGCNVKVAFKNSDLVLPDKQSALLSDIGMFLGRFICRLRKSFLKRAQCLSAWVNNEILKSLNFCYITKLQNFFSTICKIVLQNNMEDLNVFYFIF